MENYSNDYFKDAIEWELFLPMSEKMPFRFSILPNENKEDSGNSDVESSNELLGIFWNIAGYLLCNASCKYSL